MSVLPNQSFAALGQPLWSMVGSGSGPTGPQGPMGSPGTAGSPGEPGPTGPAGGSSTGAMSLVLWVDQTNTLTNNVVSVVSEYSNVVVNNGITINSNGTSNASLTLSQSGTYIFDIQGWICGAGTGETKVVATRDGSTIYDRSRGWDIACAVGGARYCWDGFQSNDVIQIYKNVNNAGALTSNVSNSPTVDQWGPIAIYSVR